MDKFERRRLRLIRVRDELCNGNVAELARRLQKPDTYVHRMLYPVGKVGKKNIGEDYVDLVREKFDVDLDESSPHSVKARAAESVRSELFYQWISAEESRLISDFRTTDDKGRRTILAIADETDKVIRADSGTH